MSHPGKVVCTVPGCTTAGYPVVIEAHERQPHTSCTCRWVGVSWKRHRGQMERFGYPEDHREVPLPDHLVLQEAETILERRFRATASALGFTVAEQDDLIALARQKGLEARNRRLEKA